MHPTMSNPGLCLIKADNRILLGRVLALSFVRHYNGLILVGKRSLVAPSKELDSYRWYPVTLRRSFYMIKCVHVLCIIAIWNFINCIELNGHGQYDNMAWVQIS